MSTQDDSKLRANKDPKHYAQFSIASIIQLKLYKSHYILVDKCGAEAIRKCINEEACVFDQIPLKHDQNGNY